MGTHRKKNASEKGKAGGHTAAPYPFDLRLKVVKLYLEDGYPAALVAQQFGISAYSVYKWCKRYRQHGEQGLMDRVEAAGVVATTIVDLKKENPGHGIRRISDILKRFFLIRASPSTVQRTLRDQGFEQTG